MWHCREMEPSLRLGDPVAPRSMDNFWDTGLPEGRGMLRPGRRSRLGNSACLGISFSFWTRGSLYRATPPGFWHCLGNPLNFCKHFINLDLKCPAAKRKCHPWPRAAGSLSLGATDIRGWMAHAPGSLPALCGMFSRIPGLHP